MRRPVNKAPSSGSHRAGHARRHSRLLSTKATSQDASYVYKRAAPSNAESSSGSHYAGNAHKRPRADDARKPPCTDNAHKRAAPSNEASSAGSHLAGNAHNRSRSEKTRKRLRTDNAHKRAAATTGIELPDVDTDCGPASTKPADVKQWLQSISHQMFDRDQVEEISKYIERAGTLGVLNLKFALSQPYYGVNGNTRCNIKARTAMREAAEILCEATFAPQINPSWSRDYYSAIENSFKDPAFKKCSFAQMLLTYSAELKKLKNSEDGLGLAELPIAFMINEIMRHALGSKISDDTEADTSGGSTPYCGKQFDFRKMTSDTIIKKINENHLVTSVQFYDAFARLLREAPRRWKIFFNDDDDKAGDDKIDRKGLAASSKPGEMIADNLWIIVGTLKGKEPSETGIGNSLYALIHMAICDAGDFKSPSSLRCDQDLGNRMETLAWFFAMGDAYHQLLFIRYILELHFISDVWDKLKVEQLRNVPMCTNIDELIQPGSCMTSHFSGRSLESRHNDFVHLYTYWTHPHNDRTKRAAATNGTEPGPASAVKRAAASNDAQSSTGSHCAGNAPKRVRLMDSKAKCKAKSPQSNDAICLKGKIVFLFADDDKMDCDLRSQLLPDKRPSLRTYEMPGFVQEFAAHIAIGADCESFAKRYTHVTKMTTGETNWQVWCNPNFWKIYSCQNIHLIPNWRYAFSMTLRRPTSCGDELQVVAVKTLKGPFGNDYFLSPRERQQVGNALFHLLFTAELPTLVLGNLGFELACLWELLKVYRRATKSDMDHYDLQIVTTEDQSLMSLFRDPTRPILGSQPILIDANASKRMMIMRLDAEESQIVKSVPFSLTSRTEHLLKLLQTPAQSSLAQVLLFPVVRKQRKKDEFHESGPVDMSSTLKLLDDALTLVQDARHHAGHETDDTPLSTTEFKKALDYLQAIFEAKMMTNKKLQAYIRILDQNLSRTTPKYPDAPWSTSMVIFNRETKQKIGSARRSAFKAWKWTLMGNTHFLHAVMRRGIFQLQDQQELVRALLEAKESSVDEHHADDVAASYRVLVQRDKLRADAVYARQQVKKAQKLLAAMKDGTKLTQAEDLLCAQFETGKLQRIRQEADEAYGHGQSVTRLSIEDAAVLRAFSDKLLDDYWRK